MGKFQFVMMSCGYVESNCTSWLLYGTQFMGHPGFDDMGEALRELALDLYAKFYDDCISVYENRHMQKDCCWQVLAKDKEAKFCAQCGNKIADKKFDADKFMRYVTDLHGSTCDSYGEAEFAANRQLVWWPWSIRELRAASLDNVIMVCENAEAVLLAALLDVKPELKKDISDGEFLGYGDDYEDYFKQNKEPSYR